MSSRIEQLIDEIEDFIDKCKYQPFSNNKIIVNKDELDSLLRELRMKTPEEIKYYQKIISNKENILKDAKMKAEALISEATAHTTDLINEHAIMQQAYAQANEVVTMATGQAQEVLDNATIEANSMRYAAMQYMDDVLNNLENIIVSSSNTAVSHYESFVQSMSHYRDLIASNKRELHPEEYLEEVVADAGMAEQAVESAS